MYITHDVPPWHRGGTLDPLDPLLQLPSILSQLLATPSGLGGTARLLFLAGLLVSFLVAARLLYRHRGRTDTMSRPVLVVLSVYILGLLSLAWSLSLTTTRQPSASVFTLSADADVGRNVIANIKDPLAVDPQSVCPGYKASNVVKTTNGITADLHLAGTTCNLYGTDVTVLALVVDHQDADRLHVGIQPKFLGQNNRTWFVLPDELIPRPPPATQPLGTGGDLDFAWGNEPSFYFNVTRRSTGDVLFSTKGTHLVYADQFIEFSSSLPSNYNLYGLGEVIHGLRLGNNLTRTLFNADVGDVVDANIYGHHPIYYDTRYFKVDSTSGKKTYAPNATDRSAQYMSYTHGVFNRNAHAQEILLRESNITWRALGGTIDLYFYDGPSQAEITSSYQKSAVGLPAMQQLWTFGFHQCRWGYHNWSEVEDVVRNFENFGIPLETIWSEFRRCPLFPG
jgi:alpha-glucosidase